MKELKILFGINADVDENMVQTMISAKAPDLKVTCYTAPFLKGITDELKKYPDINYLILTDEIDVNGIPIKWLDKLTDDYTDLKVIFLSNKLRSDQYIQDVFLKARINDILLDEDVTLESVIGLILNPRTKAQAKDYLSFNDDINIEIDDYEELIEEELLFTALNSITNSESDEQLLKNFDIVYNDFDEKQLIYLLAYLNKDIKQKLEQDFRFKHLIKKYNDIQQIRKEERNNKKSLININISKKEVTKKEVIKETKTVKIKEKEYVEVIPNDYFKVIGITGTRKSGKTLMTNSLAYYFNSRKGDIGILDFTKYKDHFINNMYARVDYDELPLNNLMNLYNDSQKIEPYKLYSNTDLFTAELQNEITYKQFDKVIYNLRTLYNLIFIDIDLDILMAYPEIYHICDQVFYIIEFSDITKYVETQNFLNYIKGHGLREDKLYPVINKYIPNLIDIEDDYDYIFSEKDDSGQIKNDYIVKPKEPFIVNYNHNIEKENIKMLTSKGITINYKKIMKLMESDLKKLANVILPIKDKKTMVDKIIGFFNSKFKKEISVRQDVIKTIDLKDNDSD